MKVRWARKKSKMIGAVITVDIAINGLGSDRERCLDPDLQLGIDPGGLLPTLPSATARDTDEIITEKVPLYFKQPGRGIRPGRNEIESVNRPVVVGGVTVIPGDVIVADGDGVIVVPRAKADEVARYAQTILQGDKAGRRSLYEQLKLPTDESVK